MENLNFDKRTERMSSAWIWLIKHTHFPQATRTHFHLCGLITTVELFLENCKKKLARWVTYMQALSPRVKVIL